MKKHKKVKSQRLSVDVPQDMHHMVKTRALKRKLSMREWLLIAITELINKEMIEEI